MDNPVPLKNTFWRSPLTRYGLISSLVCLLSCPVGAQTRTWTGVQSKEFGDTKNWDPVGGVNSIDLIVDKPASDLVLNLDSSGSKSPASLHIKNGASGFSLTTTKGNGLNIGSNITVDASTSASFDVVLRALTTSASTMTFDVGTDGTLTANGAIGVNSVNGTFVKTGAGTLVFNSMTSTIQTGVTFAFNEGVVELNNKISTQAVLVTANLGTLSTSALLRGDGTIYGTLSTAGVSKSSFEPFGTLTISNLNLSAGASFNFGLGTDLIKGTGLNAGGSLVFNLTGGVAGGTYEVFDFENVTDFSAANFSINTPGYEAATWTLDNGVVSVHLIPEPSSAVLIGSFLILGWAARKYGSRAACA